MTRQFLKETFIWGFIIWFIGYVLGIVLFPLVPHALIGWIILPLGVPITLWILLKKVKSNSFQYFLILAFIWVLIAIVFDYIFIVKLFKSQDYYKLDVLVYYAVTFILPLIVGWRKMQSRS